MYFRDKLLNEHRILRPALFVLRSILLSALALLLLGPLWKGLLTRTEKPIIIYLEDVSNSVTTFTSADDLDSYKSQRKEILTDLSGDFEVERYRFGAGVVEWTDSVNGKDKATNISQALNDVLEVHSHQNVGAVIIATDGIYNQGFNPTYSNLSSGTSIYSIAMGDSSQTRDLFVQALQYPKVVYLGDQFQLDVEWGAYNLKGRNIQVVITDEDGKEIIRKSHALDQNEQFGRESVVIDAGKPGIRKFYVRLSSGVTEDVSGNNSQTAYVEVLDGRKNVLMVYSGPHPDIKAIASVIEENKNYEVTVQSIRQLDQRVEDYDLVLLHGLPNGQNAVTSQSVLSKCVQAGKSVAVIITQGTDLAALNDWQSILKIQSTGQEPNEVQALLNIDFNDFQLPDGLNESLRHYPPIITPFAEYEAGPNSRTILYQRLDDINTGYPLIISGQQDASRVMIVAGEGLWRWRMMEYARKETTETFDKFVNQLIQYVTIKEDKRKFRLFVNSNLTWENEAIFFNAELYNANFELLNEPEVSLSVNGSDGNTYDFVMDRTLNGYKLDAGLLPVGSYTATAKSSWSGERYASNVRFTVREVQLETLNKQADHEMLFNLSDKSGGKLYHISEMNVLTTDINADVNLKPVLYNSEKTTSLLDFKWIFFILLGLLSIEWVVRKWLGGY